MPEQFGEKTHDPTPHRRQQAREQGQVAKSQDLSSAALLIGALLTLMYLGSNIGGFIGNLAQRQLGGEPWLQADIQFASNQWNGLVWELAKTLLPLFGVLVLIAMLANVFQVGFLFLPQKLAFDPNRVNPLKGVGRLFSVANAVRLVLGVGKVFVVGAVALWSLWSEVDRILGMSDLQVSQILILLAEITLWTCLKIAIALLILALIDYAYQRWKQEQDLRMTDREVRDEMKNLQGDPQIIARRRQIQRQLVMNRINSSVPEADVVVTNPTELAVAIRYEIQSMLAPIVVAKGAGTLAQRIRRLALENGVPIVERKELAQILYRDVEVNEPIPSEQYAAVAEVLRYVYELKGKSLPSLEEVS